MAEKAKAGRGRPKGAGNLKTLNGRMEFTVEEAAERRGCEYAFYVNGGRYSYIRRTCFMRLYRKHMSKANIMAIAAAVMKALSELDLHGGYTPESGKKPAERP